ncbi:Rv2231c family pyridoxal phosphate-dependent protein CobC [Propioniciclava soli]|uniref:Rv2231c family pyridoxal phosphate-dependent protein CobC n=1 Tax=Propioniciclava soli TaxID=2775081 RepID=UPI001E36D615
MSTAPSFDLDHHGDADTSPGLVDLAVNVRPGPPPWLAAALGTPPDWVAYPDPTAAREALAARHSVPAACVLPTAGAAAAFTLVARGVRARRPAIVHPQFTEPEAALLRAGAQVRRVLLPPPFTLDAALVPADADLVVLGNPTNPTGVLHPAERVRALRRPGRVLVVDEAFMDFAHESASLLGPREVGGGTPDLTGLLVVRSVTKMWGLAGVRAGYVVGDPNLIARLAAQQVPWEVSTPGLRALSASATPRARAEASAIATRTDADRAALLSALAGAGFPVPHATTPGAPFVLVDATAAGPRVRERLADRGFAVRRGETFPGLGPEWIRVAVRDAATSQQFARVLGALRQEAVEASSSGFGHVHHQDSARE